VVEADLDVHVAVELVEDLHDQALYGHTRCDDVEAGCLADIGQRLAATASTACFGGPNGHEHEGGADRREPPPGALIPHEVSSGYETGWGEQPEDNTRLGFGPIPGDSSEMSKLFVPPWRCQSPELQRWGDRGVDGSRPLPGWEPFWDALPGRRARHGCRVLAGDGPHRGAGPAEGGASSLTPLGWCPTSW
jgi:hypothetical protein